MTIRKSSSIQIGMNAIDKKESVKEKEALISQSSARRQGFQKLDNSDYQGYLRDGYG